MATVILSSAPVVTTIAKSTVTKSVEQRPLADICNEDFKDAYKTTFKSLNAARSILKNRFTIDSLKPEYASGSPFWRRLRPEVSMHLKVMFDLSVTSSHGHLDTLYSMAVDYNTCVWVSSLNKYHIADLDDAKNPIQDEDWKKVLYFTQSLIYSKKMDGRKIYRSKRMHTKVFSTSSSFYQDNVHEFMYSNNQRELGIIAACFMWMVTTKSMNKSYETQNSAAGTMVLNKEPLICRNQPKVKETPPSSTTTKTSEPATEEDEPAETEKITADDIDLSEFECENWEDLA